jgi:hypothetical protein
MAVISLLSVSSFSLQLIISVGLNGEESDAVVMVKNSRFVTRTGWEDLEHALDLTLQSYPRTCVPTLGGGGQRATSGIVGWFAGRTCASHETMYT